jgi:CheY-like chemotaxis protein
MLLVSGEEDQERLGAARQAGADGCLQKPFTREQVQLALASLGLGRPTP